MAKLKTRADGLYVDEHKVIKGWESFTGWYWFGIEIDRTQDSIINGREVVDDPIWFGYVQGLEEEYGYFSQGEIESLGKYKVWPIKAIDLPHSGRRHQREYTPEVKS